MRPPLSVLLSGLVFSAIAGGMAVLALSSNTPALLWVAWPVGSVASLLVLIGLVAVGVELGVRSARR